MSERGCAPGQRADNRLMLTQIACHVSLHPLRTLVASAGASRTARPNAAAPRARRVVRSLARPRWRHRGGLPSGAFELENPQNLTVPQLWSVWTVAHLECELALTAWRYVAQADRAKALRSYRAALAREERAALVLLDRI
jgi:hypothetical protein